LNAVSKKAGKVTLKKVALEIRLLKAILHLSFNEAIQQALRSLLRNCPWGMGCQHRAHSCQFRFVILEAYVQYMQKIMDKISLQKCFVDTSWFSLGKA
jgi:hypothetical protein